MYARAWTAIVASVVCSCSTQPAPINVMAGPASVPMQPNTAAASTPPLLFKRFNLPPDSTSPLLPGARLCQLGTSCLTMDPRPFETCLLGSDRCGEKLAEVLRVDQREQTPPAQAR